MLKAGLEYMPSPLCKFCLFGGLVLIGKAAVLKTADRKVMGVRVPRPPLDLGFRKSLWDKRKPLFFG